MDTRGNLYWTNFGDAPHGPVDGAVMTMPIAGGAPIKLASEPDSPSYIAVDGASVYFTNLLEGTVSMVPIAGGATTVLACGQPKPGSIAVDGTSVYWANRPDSVDGAIMKVAKP